jgi:Family of unknown function (DUF5681)
MDDPANAGRQQDGRDGAGRWSKGRSGNPRGRRQGSRHRATLAAAALLNGEAEAITRRAVELALEGDPTALRLCLERLLPPLRERPLEFRLPRLQGAADAPRAVAALAAAVAAGELTPGEAGELARIVETHLRAVEVADLEARIRAIEERQEGR